MIESLPHILAFGGADGDKSPTAVIINKNNIQVIELTSDSINGYGIVVIHSEEYSDEAEKRIMNKWNKGEYKRQMISHLGEDSYVDE